MKGLKSAKLLGTFHAAHLDKIIARDQPADGCAARVTQDARAVMLKGEVIIKRDLDLGDAVAPAYQPVLKAPHNLDLGRLRAQQKRFCGIELLGTHRNFSRLDREDRLALAVISRDFQLIGSRLDARDDGAGIFAIKMLLITSIGVIKIDLHILNPGLSTAKRIYLPLKRQTSIAQRVHRVAATDRSQQNKTTKYTQISNGHHFLHEELKMRVPSRFPTRPVYPGSPKGQKNRAASGRLGFSVHPSATYSLWRLKSVGDLHVEGLQALVAKKRLIADLPVLIAAPALHIIILHDRAAKAVAQRQRARHRRRFSAHRVSVGVRVHRPGRGPGVGRPVAELPAEIAPHAEDIRLGRLALIAAHADMIAARGDLEVRAGVRDLQRHELRPVDIDLIHRILVPLTLIGLRVDSGRALGALTFRIPIRGFHNLSVPHDRIALHQIRKDRALIGAPLIYLTNATLKVHRAPTP